MHQYPAQFTEYCADMPAGAFPAEIETFQAIYAVRFLVVTTTAFPPVVMDAWEAITYSGFRNFPHTHRNRPIVTQTLPVVYGSALHQQTTSPV